MKVWQSSPDTSNFIFQYIPLNDILLNRRKTRMMLTLVIKCRNWKKGFHVILISIGHRGPTYHENHYHERNACIAWICGLLKHLDPHGACGWARALLLFEPDDISKMLYLLPGPNKLLRTGLSSRNNNVNPICKFTFSSNEKFLSEINFSKILF